MTVVKYGEIIQDMSRLLEEDWTLQQSRGHYYVIYGVVVSGLIM
eukprot:CAMPEP_0119116462 /NCGR_PEP_ID=MMETSP1180-20130426/52300_1 /TAXON_ID=3052 ORGANISM="Chlamydomonas cf sp, Strain CCMP681" /NCGR_SAMPLE_ID=MMETSP1180 /ASSEMBLY_ACC=CAM_ASM_000741 /LENGTH=43 /DNA_ID= /DNA_START= /DNA_END= /DNA_ORIENTATION=